MSFHDQINPKLTLVMLKGRTTYVGRRDDLANEWSDKKIMSNFVIQHTPNKIPSK